MYTTSVYNSYRKGKTFCRNGGVPLVYTASMYNSYREGGLSLIRMEASLSLSLSAIQPLYKTHIENTDSVIIMEATLSHYLPHIFYIEPI